MNSGVFNPLAKLERHPPMGEADLAVRQFGESLTRGPGLHETSGTGRDPRVSDPPRPCGIAARGYVAGVLLLLGFAAPAKVAPDKLDQLPPPASRPIDFTKDVKPIFEASCVKCHGRGKTKGGFQLDTRETFLKDADSGPVAVPGDSRNSHLIHLVSGLDPDGVMPEKGSRLTAAQVGVLRAWIDQGLAWTEGVTFAREPHRNLKPHRPELPSNSNAVGNRVHPVDRFVWSYFAQKGIEPPALVDDRTFARRLYLDVIGLLPTPEELRVFLQDTNPDKRSRLVRQLLGDRARYAQHWMTFWNDLLRNDYRGTGYIDGGREQITPWLYAALRENLPYDRFVRELVNPGDKGPRGFTKGIVWRGAVNASQTPPLQAAQNISQVFLGVNLKCASCHDSFIDDWQLADAYGMAGIYADERLELVRCDKPLGQHAPVKFLFPELGSIDDNATKPERTTRLAELLTAPQNGRLSRTIVNRLWARFFGHGLVEPVDIMQNPAWLPDLLDWLAEDFVAHGHDLKAAMEQILTSTAYQLPSVNLGDAAARDFVFRGPGVRRLSAEQFRDTLGQLTGVWYDRPEGVLDSLLFEQGDKNSPPLTAFWIWSDAHAAEGVPPQTVFFRKTIELSEVPAEAVAFVNADNSHRLWVNGRSGRKKNDIPWNQTSVLDIRPFLKTGTNTIAVEAINEGDGPNPAGFLLYARLRVPAGSGPASSPEKVLDFTTDASWLTSTNQGDDWQKPEFTGGKWDRAQVLGPAGAAPWNLGEQFTSFVTGRTGYGTVRAALVAADPLAIALGRPNREQVTSGRPYTATTIQSLELTNGETLAHLLRQGAEKLTADVSTGEALVEKVFARGLGRKPTPEETALSVALVGEQPKSDGVEDLLWSLAMLPEFQLIY